MASYALIASREGGGAVAAPKLRNPWAAALLHLVPFYGLFWLYSVNADLRRAGAALGDDALAGTQPVLSVLAAFPGGLIVVPLVVTVYRTARRVRSAERLAGVHAQHQIQPWIVLVNTILGVLFVLPLLYSYGYIQQHANRAWRRYTPVWGAASGPAASRLGLAAGGDLALCARCVRKRLKSTPDLERELYARDEPGRVCDSCGKPLPSAQAYVQA